MTIKLKLFKNKYWDKPEIAWKKCNKPIMVMLCGLPGCGKSLIADELVNEFDFVIHASDELRKELYGDEKYQDKNAEIFKILHNRIKLDLIKGKNVIFDATNISRKRRTAFLSTLKDIECVKYCYFIPTPYETCLKNNKKRDRNVPEEVIKKMYMSFQIPHYSEGFDSIILDYSSLKRKMNVQNLIKSLYRVHQNNPNHTLSVGEHCNKAAEYISKHDKSVSLKWAALLHDIGKPFCKQFKDAKGNDTKIAHYYGHENVSAYMAIGYLKSYGFLDDEIVEIAFLINNHMRLMQLDNLPTTTKVKSRVKLLNKFGADIINKLDLLYRADKAAK